MKKHICYHCFREKGDYEVCAFCGNAEDDSPLEAYHLCPGTVLNRRYVIGKSIGFGGFGITYRAFDMTLKMIVAIKEFYPAGLVNRSPGENKVGVFSGEKQEEYKIQLERFLEEAKNMAMFSTEKDIVNVFDFFEENGTAYIIMEYIDGELLKDHLKEKGPFSVEEATTIVTSILEALKKMHKLNIIHKDISPDNIFLLGDGKVKIFDFGAAKFAQSESEKTLSAVVKAGYAPPEQYRSKGKSGPYMDLYAVGAVYYEMITGIRPVEAPDRAIEDDLVVPSKYSDQITPVLDSIIMKAMAVRPELRFQSASDFIRALKENRECLDPEEELKKRLKNRKIVIGITGGLTIGAAVLILLLSTVLSSRNKLSGVKIQDCEIQVWLKTDNEEEKAELSKLFQKDYPQVKADIVCISEEEYASKIQNAIKKDQMPDVYCTDEMIEKQISKYAASLDLLLKSMNKGDFRYYSEYETQYKDKTVLPMGYQVQVAYENSDKKSNIIKKDAVDQQTLKSTKSKDVKKMEDLSAKDYKALGEEKKDLAVIVGNLSIMEQVKDVTINQVPPSNLNIVPVLKDQKMIAEFTDCYAVNKTADKNEQYASMCFLSYMLSDGIQSMSYMSGYEAIPINENAYKEYKKAKMTSYLKFIGDYENDLIFERAGGE